MNAESALEDLQYKIWSTSHPSTLQEPAKATFAVERHGLCTDHLASEGHQQNGKNVIVFAD